MKSFQPKNGIEVALPLESRIIDKPIDSPAKVERTAACPLPAEIDAVFARALANRPVTLALQDKDLTFVWIANMHPVFAQYPLLGSNEILAGIEQGLVSKYVPLKQEVMRNQKILSVEEFIIDPNGSEQGLHFHVDFEPFKFPDGSTGILTRLVDASVIAMADEKVRELNQLLTEKVRLLKESDERLTVALSNEPILFFIQDENLRFIWVRNDILIYQGEFMLGKSSAELGEAGAPCESIAHLRREVVETGEPRFYEDWVNLIGERKYFRYDFFPFPLSNGKRGVMGKLKDMTAQKLVEEDLMKANKALTEKNRIIEAQMDEAREMQLAMLPSPDLCTDTLSLSADMQTCLQVGGDYYDYVNLPDGGSLIALGDATGHGVKSGIIVSSVKTVFNFLPESLEPGQVLSTISHHLAGLKLKQAYMGLSLLRIAGGQATFASAGMPPILRYRKDTDAVETVATGSMYLGTQYQGEYEHVTFPFSPGDVVVMLSDGYTEMRDEGGQFVTPARLSQCLKANADKGSKNIVAAFRALQADLLGGQPLYDDSTIVAVEFK